MIRWCMTILMIWTTATLAVDVQPLEIGEQAPDFSLMGVDSSMYSLQDFKKSDVLVIIFTANHCPTAQAYEDRMIQLTDDYSRDKVAVVAISSNYPSALRLDELAYSDLGDNFKEMQIRAEDKGYNFPYLYDGDTQETALAYGPQATPHVFIFDSDRKLRYQGRFDDTENPYVEPKQKDTRNAIQALLAGEPVPVKSTKVFGCSMKWKDKVDWVKQSNAEWKAKPVGVELIDSSKVAELARNDSENLLLVNVWATWCGPCVVEFPELVKMYRIYSGRDFDMVTISADKPEST
ncbi:MAG: redoxin domain-containing protein [candidate division KSB1 bacterium]|nr:redoxin domain-containing protein [candidate division KSB1 bacterium]